MTDTPIQEPPQSARQTPNASRASSPRLTRLALAAALFGLLYSFYLLTFSGVFNSDDERYILDTTESIVKRGGLMLNQTTYIRPYRTSGVEPAQPLLAVPLFWVADHVSFAGNAQTTFLFNPLVTALTAVLLFYFALDVGYGKREALLAGVLFGIGTIAWPYTRTFFREPLAGLSLFASLFFFHKWRKALSVGGRGEHWGWLALGVGAFVVSALTKEAALIAAPVVVAYAIPTRQALRANRRSLLVLGASVLAAGILLALTIVILQSEAFVAIAGRYAVARKIHRLLFQGLAGAGEGIVGFLVSPGKSVFIYSPLALLAPAAFLVREKEHRRESWLAMGLLLIFIVIYATEQGPLWHGGSGWGPRYLVPLTPVLILAGLPVAQRALASTNLWPKVGLALLALLSVLAQVPGLIINIHAYYAALNPLGRGAPWTLGIWQVKYSPILGHLRLARRIPLDLVWVRPETDWAAIGLLVSGAVVFGGLLVWLARRPVTKRAAGLAIVGSLVLGVGLSGFALNRAHDDPYYYGDDPSLFEMLTYLYQSVAPGDPILLSNPQYVNFFANYYKADDEWFSMPRSPGERHSEDEVPQVVSDDPQDLVSQQAVGLMRFVAQSSPGHSLWLVVDGGPFTPWYPRPPEWWAAERYYTVHTEEFSATARVVQYLSFPAPDLDAPPAHAHGGHLGESIVLQGYDLDGLRRSDVTAFHPGDDLGLSLVWRADAAPAEDYVAAVFLIGPDGELALQQDRVPVASFRPTSTWQPGETLRDNYGFVLPTDLPPGLYEIWTAMYSWPSLERLPATSPAGDDLDDHLVVAAFELLP